MSKREARIARKNKRKLEQKEKSARLVLEMQSAEARTGYSFKEHKNIRTGANPDSIFGMSMTWSHQNPDCCGVWSWDIARQWSDENWENTILPKLKEWEQLNWSEIDGFSSGTGHKMHHNMDTSDICDEAQLRLMEIEKYNDEIFRFRLGGLPRLWGFRTVANFDILWFDPTHQIYPTNRK